MKLRAMLKSCFKAEVAHAALLSIGGELAATVAAEAERRREPLGPFVAGLVRDFEGLAGTCVWARAERAMQGSAQPALAGLYVVIAHGLLRHNLLGRSARVEAHAAPEPAAGSESVAAIRLGLDRSGRPRAGLGGAELTHRQPAVPGTASL